MLLSLITFRLLARQNIRARALGGDMFTSRWLGSTEEGLGSIYFKGTSTLTPTLSYPHFLVLDSVPKSYTISQHQHRLAIKPLLHGLWGTISDPNHNRHLCKFAY